NRASHLAFRGRHPGRNTRFSRRFTPRISRVAPCISASLGPDDRRGHWPELAPQLPECSSPTWGVAGQAESGNLLFRHYLGIGLRRVSPRLRLPSTDQER